MAEERQIKMANNNEGMPNWLWAVGGIAALGLLVYWVFKKPDGAIAELLDDIEEEIAELITYTHRVADESLPEEVYSPVMETMNIALIAKIERAKEIMSEKSVIDRVRETLWQFGQDVSEGILYLLIGIGSIWFIGYLIKRIIKHIRKPPNYQCPQCPQSFTSEAALRNHIEATHPVTTSAAQIAAAQLAYQALPLWVQSGVATEAGVADRAYENWTALPYADVKALAIASAILVACMVATSPMGVAALMFI